MAKRSNPFIEDYIQQSKVHVGLKQFNNNEGRLQKVYEKTLNLLFKGANSKGVPSRMILEAPPDVPHSKLKQLFIGRNGALERDGAVMASERGGGGGGERGSCACGGAAEARCAYCEAALCPACARACLACDHAYCARCCIAASDVDEVCVSCYQ